jgi:proline dehydrogenase
LCAENLDRILQTADVLSTFVRIDMEDSQWVDKTLNLFESALEKYGSERIGIVIQSYLYRSEKDVSEILQAGGRIRMCKGAYMEPEDIAFPDKADVDENFDLLVDKMYQACRENGTTVISEDGRIPPIPAIASHDDERIKYAKQLLGEFGLPKESVEFQMLHGIRRDLQVSLSEEGYPVRVYVPYGSEWYPYFTRRLAERPANLWFFISNYFR